MYASHRTEHFLAQPKDAWQTRQQKRESLNFRLGSVTILTGSREQDNSRENRSHFLTEEPFFLLLAIPPKRNFRPATFFPFPFFLLSLVLFIFFRTPGPRGKENSPRWSHCDLIKLSHTATTSERLRIQTKNECGVVIRDVDWHLGDSGAHSYSAIKTCWVTSGQSLSPTSQDCCVDIK